MKATPGWVVIVASAVMVFGVEGGLFAEGAETAPPPAEEVKPAETKPAEPVAEGAETAPPPAEEVKSEETKAAEALAAEVEREKALKAQEKQIEAKKHSDEADKFIQDGKYDEAVEELNAAIAADPQNATCREKLLETRVAQVNAMLSGKKFAEAKALCDKLVEQYPGEPRINRFREQAEEAIAKPAPPEQPKRAVTPPPVEAPVTVEQLLAEAEDSIVKKDYQTALDKLLDARKLNPFDISIDKRIKQVHELLSRYERAYYEAMREELLTQVYRAWTKRPRRAVKPGEIVVTPEEPVSQAKLDIIRKLNTVIPEVTFEDAKLKEVVDYLSTTADVNIVIDPVVFTGYTSYAPSTTGAPTTGIPGELGPGPTPDVLGPTFTPGMPSSVAPGITPGIPGETSGVTPTPTWVPPSTDTGITIRLKAVPLKEVLRYVLRVRNLKYIVEDYAISVVPVDWVAPESMETEIFRLATTGLGTIERPVTTGGPGAGPTSSYDTGTRPGRPSLLSGPREPGAGPGETGGPPTEGEFGSPQTIRDYLIQSGVPWPRGSNIIYNSRTSTLIVSNTPTNMLFIRELIRMWDVPALQVEIEARFVELLHTRWFENSFQAGLLAPYIFTQKAKGGPVPSGVRRQYQVDVRPERGMRYLPEILPTEFPTPDADQILSIRGIMTEPDFAFVWRAIDQRDWSDLLSAPRLTTISGQNAQIEVVQELTYPTEYDTETINIGGGFGGTTNLLSGEVFMVTPGNWQTRDVGIILNVTPTVSADGKMISLILMPEVTDLVRWINYGNEIYPIQQPVFETRQVTTSVHVEDGETIVLGGLITDKTTNYEDKVPLLGSIPFVGRFFRTTIETSSKANLIIFVTARLITSKGTELAAERPIREEQARRLQEELRKRTEETGEIAPETVGTGIIE
jgi:general secretion pathway protein D